MMTLKIDGWSRRSFPAQEAPQPVAPCAEQLQLTLEELQKYQGQDGGRILMSVGGAVFVFSGKAKCWVKLRSVDVPRTRII